MKYIHIISAIVAMAVGIIIFIRAKGDRFHIVLGWTYIVSMVIVNMSALSIYRLTNGINMFHLFAIVNLFTTLLGIYFILSNKPNRINRHVVYFVYSYTGLVAAFFAEFLTRIVGPSVPREFSLYIIIITGAIAFLIPFVASPIIIRIQLNKFYKKSAQQVDAPDALSGAGDL